MPVGIDIGGTKTHIAFRDSNGSVRDDVFPSAHWRRGGLFGDSENANRLVGALRALSGDADPGALAIGAHGCDTPADCARFERLMEAAYGRDVTVVNDAQLLVPAAGHDAGLAVIVGTGSIVVGSSPAEPMLVSGGHGWLFGDPGSAPGIVRESVKHVLQGRDQNAGSDLLTRRLTDFYDVNDVTGLIYTLSVTPEIEVWGAAAPLVFEAADDGSEVAALVISQAAESLVGDVLNVYQRGAVGSAIVCAGGVVTNQPRLFDAFRDRIAEVRPEASVELLKTPPVLGALALADSTTHPLRDDEPNRLLT
ncbi:BadF/BadG/BcrA/BcrD ATPase family protein [Paramicrobacterium agarici]|uniref:N-acetylglucosamine kinase-like BadF-type ATPase n=1 Tax=Paramicrobacterium agarici TaxID=630514 RepID=A0A2A9E132_9MICO|nr:BadF/BadG/BcrA/BcrD ATPase family protein [Microbacterium agarici]PFG32085.1 N-acetylglucosamine kinase-like BadF-type ATPase [Microbacterium agarici]TQO21978.1 N-acetylglucosamine kinase-like BadF-type ATPase [Microbacterium agarici]